MVVGTAAVLGFILTSGSYDKAVLSVQLWGLAIAADFLVGSALGVLAAVSDRFSRLIRPINHRLQTMPPFVLRAPIVTIFKIGAFSALLAIISGISMLVITALVGTDELGQVIYIGPSKGDFGIGFLAGIAMAVIAILADQFCRAWQRQIKAGLGEMAPQRSRPSYDLSDQCHGDAGLGGGYVQRLPASCAGAAGDLEAAHRPDPPWACAVHRGRDGVGLGLYSTSIVLAPVIRMTMEFYLTSVWSTIIGVIWLAEKLDLRRIVTVVMRLEGLFLLLTGGSDLPEMALGLGDVLAITSGILWALGAAGMKRWPAPFVRGVKPAAFAQRSGDLLGLPRAVSRQGGDSDDVRRPGGDNQRLAFIARRDHDRPAMVWRRNRAAGLPFRALTKRKTKR